MVEGLLNLTINIITLVNTNYHIFYIQVIKGGVSIHIEVNHSLVTRDGCALRISRGMGMTLGIIATCHNLFVVSE